MTEKAKWIGVSESEKGRCGILEGDMTGRFAYFTCTFTAKKENFLNVEVSANSRYKLYVNGKLAVYGPEKGNLYRHYYERMDISAYLTDGINLLAAQVLYQDPDSDAPSGKRSAIYAVVSPRGGHRFLLEGNVRENGTSNQSIFDLTTGVYDGWRCRIEDSYYLTADDRETYFLGATAEHVDMKMFSGLWKRNPDISSRWAKAECREPAIPSKVQQATGFIERLPLTERDIPMMELSEDSFFQAKEFCNDTITIPAGTCKSVILDIGYVRNVFLTYHFQGGKSGKILFSCFEKFVKKDQEIRRDDVSGEIYHPFTDSVQTDGREGIFEPFWHRTFRFLKIDFTAGKTDLIFDLPQLIRTGYPLKEETEIESDIPWIPELFRMCTRTLRACMTETYNDSPLYEQMQYPMDTRLQMLFTYVLTSDTRLAEKAIRDFHDAILPSGLLPGKAPSAYPQIISTFSLHYIYLLWEYYWQTGNRNILRKYRADVDRILEYYDSRIEDQYQMVGWAGYWPFVDWQKAWNGNAGTPASEEEGPSAIINLMYGYALLTGAKIMEATGRHEVAAEYRQRQKRIADAVKKYCWCEERKLFCEGPELKNGYSQHAQSWAVLNGLVRGTQAKELMQRATDPLLIPVSFSTSFEFFRACEIAGEYELAYKQMQKWIGLIDLHCATCPEEPEGGRSECHGWSALPMYEIIRSIAGIRPAAPGWKEVMADPHPEYLDLVKKNVEDSSEAYFCGKTITPRGVVRFEFRKENGMWKTKMKIPDTMEIWRKR